MWSSFKTINHLVHKRIPYKIHSLQTHCMMRVLEKLVYNRYIIFINHTPTHTYFLCLYSICEYMIFKKEKIQTTQFFLVKSKLSTTTKVQNRNVFTIFFRHQKIPQFFSWNQSCQFGNQCLYYRANCKMHSSSKSIQDDKNSVENMLETWEIFTFLTFLSYWYRRRQRLNFCLYFVTFWAGFWGVFLVVIFILFFLIGKGSLG